MWILNTDISEILKGIVMCKQTVICVWFATDTMHVLTINISANIRTLLYTICDKRHLLHVSAPRYHPQGDIITKLAPHYVKTTKNCQLWRLMLRILIFNIIILYCH
jgi:hypothetical protein